MMTTDNSDERLLSQLREIAMRHDAPPAHVRDAARAALTWRTIDEELAELCYDSLAQAPATAGVRDDGDGTRTLSFETNGRGVEIEVIEQGDRRRVVGQLLPPGPGRVEIRSGRPEQVVEVEADHLGRFQADDLPRGPIRLRCQPDDRAAISTTWINI